MNLFQKLTSEVILGFFPYDFVSGWTISTNCSDYGIFERDSKASSRAAVNGGYQYYHYAICDTGMLQQGILKRGALVA